jgi:hypothetical protein
MGILKVKKPAYKNSRIDKMREELINPKNTASLNLNFDAGLIKKFKIKTVSEGITMTEVLTDAIKKYLSS